jgi:uracil-DNA glycosylase
MSLRLDVMEQVISCTACELHKVATAPVAFSGRTPNYVAVLGEAPGKTEDVAGRPFVGQAGVLLRGALKEAGIDPESVTYINSVCCYPDGTPTSAHVNACSTNLSSQLELVDPVWVLCLGNTALSTIRPGAKVTRYRGHVLNPTGTGRALYYVTFHPAAAMRSIKTDQVFRDDLRRFAQLLNDNLDGQEWLRLVDDSCVVCGVDTEDMGEHGLAVRFDQMEASYCSDCYAKLNAPKAAAPTTPVVQLQL